MFFVLGGSNLHTFVLGGPTSMVFIRSCFIQLFAIIITITMRLLCCHHHHHHHEHSFLWPVNCVSYLFICICCCHGRGGVFSHPSFFLVIFLRTEANIFGFSCFFFSSSRHFGFSCQLAAPRQQLIVFLRPFIDFLPGFLQIISQIAAMRRPP